MPKEIIFTKTHYNQAFKNPRQIMNSKQKEKNTHHIQVNVDKGCKHISQEKPCRSGERRMTHLKCSKQKTVNQENPSYHSEMKVT